MNRQSLMPTFLTLALYVDWFFFFFFSFSIPSADGFLLLQISRGCQIFECTRLERAELLSNSLLPPPHSRVLSLPQTAPPQPPALRPLHVIPKEQKKEKENKKRRASNQERAGVQGKKRLKRTEGEERERMDSHKTQRLRKFSSAIGSAAWVLRSGVISAPGLDSTSGVLLGNPQPRQELHQAASTTEATENPALYQRGKVSPTHSHAQAVRLYYAANPLLVSLTCTCF